METKILKDVYGVTVIIPIDKIIKINLNVLGGLNEIQLMDGSFIRTYDEVGDIFKK